MRKKGVLLVVALAAILGVCACGTKQKKEAVFPGLIIGGTSYTPYFYQDINGNYSGIDVDVAKETDIFVEVNLDGHGRTEISTGLGFFDHMLDQIGKHSGMDLTVRVKGDLEVDEHHTIEDTAIALGEALSKALGDKRGIERYGYCLPMDDCLCSVALDFGGRPWLVWDAEFRREKVGDMPTEMFLHFFKSLSDAARMNLNIRAEGVNEHHKIEGIFKALARSIKMAIRRDIYRFELPDKRTAGCRAECMTGCLNE